MTRTLLAVLALAATLPTTAHAATPAAAAVQSKLEAQHVRWHTPAYPAGTQVVARCSLAGTRTWSCKVRIFSSALPNGGTVGANEIWRYVATASIVRRGRGLVATNFKAYAVGAIG